MNAPVLALKLSARDRKRLEAVAKVRRKNGAAYAAEIVRRHVDHELSDAGLTEQSVAEMLAGKLILHDEVMKDVFAVIKAAKKKRAIAK